MCETGMLRRRHLIDVDLTAPADAGDVSISVEERDPPDLQPNGSCQPDKAEKEAYDRHRLICRKLGQLFLSRSVKYVEPIVIAADGNQRFVAVPHRVKRLWIRASEGENKNVQIRNTVFGRTNIVSTCHLESCERVTR